jgi:hypothetical protein
MGCSITHNNKNALLAIIEKKPGLTPQFWQSGLKKW